MTILHQGKFGQWALWSPIIIVPVAFFASLPWLDQQNDTIAKGITAATAIFVLGYSVFLAARVNRRMDEVEIAGQRFAQTKGMTIGSIAAALVMIFPPTMNALVDLANINGSESPDLAIKLGISIGFMLVLILQVLGMAAVALWWGRRVMGPQA